MNSKKPIIHEPSKTEAVIIWMHGLGASANDFEGIMPLLPIKEVGIRMIFPNAPQIPVTVNNNMVMPAWYDITDFSRKHIDRKGIAKSNDYIQGLIQEQINQGIPSDRIIIAGFSQGGAMAIHCGTRCPYKLAGVLALSCYILEQDTHLDKRENINIKTPIWMGHGIMDSVVPYDLGKSSMEFLVNSGHKVTFANYQMQHEVVLEEINALSKWISEILKK